jgi:hypothetical protein
VVKAHGEKTIGFVMKPGVFEQIAPEKAKRIKERPAWFMLKFGFTLSYNGLTIPGGQGDSFRENRPPGPVKHLQKLLINSDGTPGVKIVDVLNRFNWSVIISAWQYPVQKPL